MAKTTGTFFSLEASGTIFDIITTAKHGKLQVTKKKNIPTNPNTEHQQQNRTRFNNAVLSWQTLSPADKQWWRNEEKHSPRKSGYNIFISYFMSPWGNLNPWTNKPWMWAIWG